MRKKKSEKSEKKKIKLCIPEIGSYGGTEKRLLWLLVDPGVDSLEYMSFNIVNNSLRLNSNTFIFIRFKFISTIKFPIDR